MSTSLRAIVERLFAAFEAKDLEGVLAQLAHDAVLIDPHYPAPRMVGKAAIAGGVRWAFNGMKTLRFTLVHYYESEDGHAAAVEVSTAHVLKTGMQLNFSQVFVIETHAGLITRVQAYEPYGPGGIGGLFLGAIRLKRRVFGASRR